MLFVAVYFLAHCQKITDPLNGRKYGTRFLHGAIASFECNVGYKLVGSRSLLCVDGNWNASVPVCNGKTFKETAASLEYK